MPDTESAESVVATDAVAAARAAPWTGDPKERLTMINHGIHAALAHERMSTFLAQAEADRLAKRARRPRRGRKVRLGDGLALLIRPVPPIKSAFMVDLHSYWTNAELAAF